MKLLYLLSLMIIPLSVIGKTTRIIDFNYNEKDFQFHEYKGLTYIGSSTYQLQFNSDTSAPALPFINANILIGPDEYIDKYEVFTNNRIVLKNVNMACNSPCYTTSDSISALTQDNYTFDKSSYPDSLVRYYGVRSTQGFLYGSFLISPFSYKKTDNGTCLYINHFSIKIYINKVERKQRHCFVQSDIIKNMVANPNDVERYYSTPAIKSPTRTGNDYDYIIVTCDSLKDIFLRFATWKTQKGVKTKVITVEEIYSQSSIYSNPCERIKQALSNYYNNGLGCKYILLGGDVNIIPAYSCFVRFNSASTSREILTRFTATDLFYGSFSDMTWDNNNNNIYGEIDDNIDPSPSVSIARLPIKNRENASIILERIMSYEKGEHFGAWNNKILMFGGKNNDFCYMPYKSIAHYFCDTIYTCDIIASGIERFRYYDTDTDYPSGAAYNLNAAELQTEMEKGYHFIHGDSHGFHTFWALEGSNYYCEDALAFVNPCYSHFITNACWTNEFTQNCLSKSFFQNPNSGILSYFGSSVENFIDNNPYFFLYDEYIAHTYYDKLLTSNPNLLFNYRRLGDVVKSVKESIISDFNINTYNFPYRWLLFSMNILGDPEMPIYTSTPQKQDGITFNYSNGVLSINTLYNPSTLAEICIMSLLDQGEAYYYRSSICYNQSFSLPDGEYSICIKKPGFIPYTFYVGNNIHIQNEMLIGDYIISGKNVYVGKDVTTLKTEGPVTIPNGKTTIHADSSILIKNNFEVKKGSQLIIE